jgi:dTDP-4-dehydrorhamnose reductase
MDMSKKRALITGGSGLLALNWSASIRDSWDVTLGTHRHVVELAGTNSCPLNLDSQFHLTAQLQQLKPDLVIHTAGLTSVDQCERYPDLAHQANAQIARNVAQATAAYGASLIHISTDHLFAGQDSLCRESDQIQPVNEYARTKALAELWVQESHSNALIIRTNFFGWGHQYRESFSDWLIHNLRAGKSLTLFDDVFFTPILADTVALNAHALLDRGASGVFHLVGDERLSKYDFALKLAKHFDLPVNLINRAQLALAELLAPRPHDMSLDNGKAKMALGFELGGVDDFLRSLKDQERLGRKTELRCAVKQQNERIES